MEDRVDELIKPAKTSTVSSYLEEKRLAYVALTRTKQELHVYTKKGQESPFLDGIDDHFHSQTVSGPDSFSGMVTEATVVEGNRLKGELDCDNLRQTLSFVCLRWNLSDETFDDIVSTLETGTRCRIEQADDRTMDSFNDDIEITASTDVNQIPQSDTESDSASSSPDSSA